MAADAIADPQASQPYTTPVALASTGKPRLDTVGDERPRRTASTGSSRTRTTERRRRSRAPAGPRPRRRRRGAPGRSRRVTRSAPRRRAPSAARASPGRRPAPRRLHGLRDEGLGDLRQHRRRHRPLGLDRRRHRADRHVRLDHARRDPRTSPAAASRAAGRRWPSTPRSALQPLVAFATSTAPGCNPPRPAVLVDQRRLAARLVEPGDHRLVPAPIVASDTDQNAYDYPSIVAAAGRGDFAVAVPLRANANRRPGRGDRLQATRTRCRATRPTRAPRSRSRAGADLAASRRPPRRASRVGPDGSLARRLHAGRRSGDLEVVLATSDADARELWTTPDRGRRRRRPAADQFMPSVSVVTAAPPAGAPTSRTSTTATTRRRSRSTRPTRRRSAAACAATTCGSRRLRLDPPLSAARRRRSAAGWRLS